MAAFRIHAPILNPISSKKADWFPDGALAVDDKGLILFVGYEDDLPESLDGLPKIVSGDIIIPGLIDLHVHLPQYDCRGKFGKTLIHWLEEFIYPEEARFSDPAVAAEVSERFFKALAHNGTTTAMVYSSVHAEATHLAFEAADRSGLRIIMGKVQMNREAPKTLLEDTKTSLRTTTELIRAWHRKTPKLWYAVTPRFALTCTDDLLAGCGALAQRYDTYIQTHVNESREEIARIAELFPKNVSYTDVYLNTGLLNSKTVLAHNIYPSDEELHICEVLRCSVAHCPDSNLFLGSGRFPLERYESTNIRVGLGSDVGAGTTLSMFHVMRCMSYVQAKSLHPFLPLYSATFGNAKALGLDREIGNFAAGKQADFLSIHVDPHFCGGKPLQKLLPLEIASAIVYRAQAEDIREVWVGGESTHC